MNKDLIKYSFDRVDRDNIQTSAKVFGFTIALNLIFCSILFFVLFILYFLSVLHVSVLIIAGIFVVTELSILIISTIIYSKNRTQPKTAFNYFHNGSIELYYNNTTISFKKDEIIDITYKKLFVPVSYAIRIFENSEIRSRGYTPFYKIADEGIITFKTKSKSYKISVVNNLKNKIEHIKSIIK